MALQSVRLVRWQTGENLYCFLAVVRHVLQEGRANARVGKCLLDSLRLPINVAPQFCEGCGFGLPKPTT
jgi:hypothetical protein